MTSRGVDGVAESALRALFVVKRLDCDRFVRFEEVHQGVGLGKRGVRKRLFVEHEAGECVAVDQPDQRMQARLFDTSGVGDGKIDTGAEPLVEHLRGGADLLPRVLK